MADSRQDPTPASIYAVLTTDTRNLYERGRDLAGRLVKGVSLGVAGALGGFAVGVVAAPGGTKDRTEVAYLLRQVRLGKMVRDMAPMATTIFTDLEYEARKRLEELGYYPCSDCGVPHVSDVPHDFPEGTYWCDRCNRYLKPDDADWTAAGFRGAPVDAKWAYVDQEDEPQDDGEQVH